MTLSIAPPIRQQFMNGNGDPRAGESLYIYNANTTELAITYRDSAGATQNSNPIILDAQGRTPYGIWLLDDEPVKFHFCGTEDYIETKSYPTGISEAEWIINGTPTYISASSFSVTEDQTALFHPGRRIKATVTAGTTYATVASSTYADGITTIGLGDLTLNLDSGLSAVYYGFLSYSNTSIPADAVIPYCQILETKGYGVNAGDITITNADDRPINVIAHNTTDIAFHPTFTDTLVIPPGTYQVEAFSVMNKAGGCQLSFSDVMGLSGYANGTDGYVVQIVSGQFTLAVESNRTLRQCNELAATNGLGLAVSDGTNEDEIYASIELWKLA